MTHVVDRSSGGGSSVAPSEMPAVFDIATEGGTLALLRAIHRSGTKQKTRNELRDYIFSLDRGNKESVRQTLEALQQAGFSAMCAVQAPQATDTPVASVSSAPTRLGRVRITPSFAAVKPMSVDKAARPVTSTPQPAEAKAVEVVPQTASPRPPVPPVEVAATPTVAVAPQPVPEQTETSKPSVEANNVRKVKTPEPVLQAETTSVPQTPPSEAPATDSSVQDKPPVQAKADPAERIKEIKRIVNEKVGNPITLIDTDNQVGREYMNALLSAMKLQNGGKPEELVAAMNRLEHAFRATLALLETRPAPESVTDTFLKTTASSVAPRSPSSLTPPPASGFETTTPKATPQAVPSASQPSAIPGGAASVKLSVTQVPEESSHSSLPIADNRTPEATASVAAPAATSVSLIPKKDASQVVAAQPVVFTPPPSNLASTPVESPQSPDAARMMSVAKEEQIETLMRQKKFEEQHKVLTEAEKAEMSGDPLMTQKVTAGLKQLLSEWGLFKSSGFFGTGPGGVDHPLYKQMAGLTMAAVIAGRFEGATPQVKQSITDYMNGWRYEEGIMHEHTETFEHYLRRVIHHILEGKGNSRS